MRKFVLAPLAVSIPVLTVLAYWVAVCVIETRKMPPGQYDDSNAPIFFVSNPAVQ